MLLFACFVKTELGQSKGTDIGQREDVEEPDIGKEDVLVSGFVHQHFERDSVSLVRVPQDIYDLVHRYFMEIKQSEKEKERLIEEEKANLRIQEDIQKAIALFQEEFGAELEEELANMEEFRYEST